MNERFEEAKTRFFAGLASQQAGDDAEAERHYLASLGLVPGRASTLINLAAVRLRLGRAQEALASANAALAAERDSSDALLHRATALARLGRADEALAAFQRLLAIEPHHAAAWSASGTLLREMNRLDEAAHAFREAVRLGADSGLHDFYLAAVAATGTPARPPQAYVAGLFDGYADEFDAHLVGALRYQAHRELVAQLDASGADRFACALDLGCGTGLCGPLVRSRVDRLTGVDLSPRMLDKARALAVYDRLVQADIVEFLDGSDERFDLVLAADVFIYVGDLAAVFARLHEAMPSGVFCFSVESLAEGGADYRLLPSLRYAHSTAYLLRLAREHGFALARMERAPVREEQRRPIEGLYVVLRRTGP